METIRGDRNLPLGENMARFSERFSYFIERNGLVGVVGIIGASSVDRNKAEVLDDMLFESLSVCQERVGRFAVVCGGTEGGVPEIAALVSNRVGLPVIGVVPERGEKYVLKNGTLNLCMIIPRPICGETSWGSEAPVLASMPNSVAVAGGEWGTMIELASIMKQNKSKRKEGKRRVPLAIIEGSGGICDIFRRTNWEDLLPDCDQLCMVQNSRELTEVIVRGF
jgi:hypothetical protein